MAGDDSKGGPSGPPFSYRSNVQKIQSFSLEQRLRRADRERVGRMSDRMGSERGSVLVEVLVSAILLDDRRDRRIQRLRLLDEGNGAGAPPGAGARHRPGGPGADADDADLRPLQPRRNAAGHGRRQPLHGRIDRHLPDRRDRHRLLQRRHRLGRLHPDQLHGDLAQHRQPRAGRGAEPGGAAERLGLAGQRRVGRADRRRRRRRGRERGDRGRPGRRRRLVQRLDRPQWLRGLWQPAGGQLHPRRARLLAGRQRRRPPRNPADQRGRRERQHAGAPVRRAGRDRRRLRNLDRGRC